MQFAEQKFAELGAAFRQFPFFNLLDLRQRHGATDGVAEEGAGVDRLAPRRRPRVVHEVRASDAGRKRKTASERLAQANQIRHDSTVFAGKPFSGAAKAGENFIEDEQRAEFVANFPQHRQKFLWRNIDAAARLHRFDEDRANPFAVKKPANDPFDGGDVAGLGGELHEMTELTKLGMERTAKEIAMGGVKRPVAESMIRAGKRDNAVLAGGEQGGLERGFNGFKTGIAENDFA